MRNLTREALKNLSLELEKIHTIPNKSHMATAMQTLQLAVEFATSAKFVIATDPNGKTCRLVRISNHAINLDGDKDTCYGQLNSSKVGQRTDYKTGSGVLHVLHTSVTTDRGYKNTSVRKVFVPGITKEYNSKSYNVQTRGTSVADTLHVLTTGNHDTPYGVHRLVALAASWAGATRKCCRDMNSSYWKFIMEDLAKLSLGEMQKVNLTQGLSYITALQVLMCQIAIEYLCDRGTQEGAQAYSNCVQIMLNDGVYDQAELNDLSRIAQGIIPLLFNNPGTGILYYEVNHMNFGRDDNYPSNLEFVTQNDNRNHRDLMNKLLFSSAYNHLFNGEVCRYSMPAEVVNQFCGYFSQLPGSILASPHWLQHMLLSDKYTETVYDYSDWDNTNIFVKQSDGSYRKITVVEHEALEKLSSQDRINYFRARGNANVRLQIINTLTEERDRNVLMYCGNPKVITTTPPAGAQVRDALLIDECVTFAQALYGFAV